MPVHNVEIYIETLSDCALEDPTCTETSKEVIFTGDTQSFFPEEPWPMVMHPMSCIWIKFEYEGLPLNTAHKMIKVVHHLEQLTQQSREKLMGCPTIVGTQTRAEKTILSQNYIFGVDKDGTMRFQAVKKEEYT